MTENPARALNLQGIKGTLSTGADADLVILEDSNGVGYTRLSISEVWKFGHKVFTHPEQHKDNEIN